MRSPSKKTSIPKGNMISNGEYGLFCFLEQDRTTSDFLGICYSGNWPRKAAADILPCRPGCLVLPWSPWRRDGVQNWWLLPQNWLHVVQPSQPPVDVHLPSCDQHQTGLAWEVVQPAKDMNILKISFSQRKQNCVNSPKTPAQQFYELTIKEAFIFLNSVLY